MAPALLLAAGMNATKSILLVACALSLLACDTEEFDIELDELETEVLETGVPGPDIHDELGLAVGLESEQSNMWKSVLNTTTRTDLHDTQDGDLVMFRSLTHGYLGCADGDVIMTPSMENLNRLLWKVHRVDWANSGGSYEYFLENVDANGLTGEFLKITGSGGGYELYCGPITGTGVNAVWTAEVWANTGGSFATLLGSQLHHVTRDRCVGTVDEGVVSTTCAANRSEFFRFEVLGNIAFDCDENDVCRCSNDLQCPEANQICGDTGYCQLSI